jgi:hypothetical protein
MDYAQSCWLHVIVAYAVQLKLVVKILAGNPVVLGFKSPVPVW